MIGIKRVTEKSDIVLLSQMAESIWREHFTPIIGEKQVTYMLNLFLSADAIEKAIQEGYEFYFMQEKEPIGFLSIHEETEEKRMFLSKLYLYKEHRGKGYAREALSFLEKEVKERELEKIWLTCNKCNKTTLSIYDALGFTIFDEAVNDIGNGYVMDDYYLEKRIN